MTVNGLIKYLQAFAPTADNKRVTARDDNGRLSTYLELWNDKEMNDYINDNFDTGFLSPYLNFALFCASFIIATVALIWGIWG